MEHRGVVITAGFGKSKYAIAIAQLLRQKGIPVKGFIVVSPYSPKRLRKYLKKRGFSFLKEALHRLAGQGTAITDRSHLDAFMQNHDIHYRSVKAWAAEHAVDILNVNSLNEDKTVIFLKKQSPQWLIYGGGGIIKEKLIKAINGRILNAHQGPLPEIRGMNAAEWAILLNKAQEVTIHLIDRGIDTGKIITSRAFSLRKGESISAIRDKAKIKCIEALVEVASNKSLTNYTLRNNNAQHRQCYILSPVMKGLLHQKVRKLQNR